MYIAEDQIYKRFEAVGASRTPSRTRCAMLRPGTSPIAGKPTVTSMLPYLLVVEVLAPPLPSPLYPRVQKSHLHHPPPPRRPGLEKLDG